MDEKSIRTAVEEILSLPHHMLWFCAATNVVASDGKSAAEQFFALASTSDISPFRFFDPKWFRSKYSVSGPNAFLSYVRNRTQRLAIPSPVFAPRWYCRHYALNPAANPLLDFLTRGDERDPHPLIDIKFLKEQDPLWYSGAIALKYIVDPTKFHLKPHPLFDGKWYLDNNPDVAAAGINPLEHYLQFGCAEDRNPNRIFNVRWYKRRYLNSAGGPKSEPFTSYLISGAANARTPAPGLVALSKTSVTLNRHGPQPLIDRMLDGESLYASLRHRPNIRPDDFRNFMSGRIHDYNPSFPQQSVILSKKRLAIMYTPKCASAKLLYWWQDHSNLLEFALKFSDWSHSFEYVYRMSRSYLDDALTFDPRRYQVYKFVRNPLYRAISSFTHLLAHSEYFGISVEDKRMSFMEFLELMKTSNYLGNEPHFRPQVTELESTGKITPRILKIEEGMEAHLRSLERSHGLGVTTYERHPEIRKLILSHAKQARRNMFVGPHVRIPFRSIPAQQTLLTDQSILKVYELYRVDFESYGYSAPL